MSDHLENHPSYFAIIPANVRYCKDLEPSAKLLYGEITALCNKEGYCWAGDKYFADLYGAGLSTIKKWISSLKKLGFIWTEQYNVGFHKKRRIYIVEIKKSIQSLENETMHGLENETIGSLKNETIYMNNTLPILHGYVGNAPTPKKKEALKKAVPLLYSKKENSGSSKKRKYPRNSEHQACFDWLMTLNITDEKGHLCEDEMSFLSHKYSMKRLEDAHFHMMHKIKTGKTKPKSLIAVFKHLLNQEHSPINQNCEVNLQYANDFKECVTWNSLEIHEKYVEDVNFPGKDISLNIDPKEFQSSLDRLFNSISKGHNE